MVEDKGRQTNESKCTEEKDQRCEGQLFKGLTEAFSIAIVKLLSKISLATPDIVTCNPYRVDGINPNGIDKEPKVDVIALAYTVRYERAVVIKHFDTDIAGATVN